MALVTFEPYAGEYVAIERLIDHIRNHRLADGRAIPLLIWGGAGIGKTQQIKAYARKNNLVMKTYHPAHDTSGGDIVGTPYHDEETGMTKYALPDWLPKADEGAGILFIDEINRAQPDVLAGLMEVLGEGTISQSGWEIPEGWAIVVAANPSEVNYDVAQLDAALIDRVLHYAPGWDAARWLRWADSVGLHPNVIRFTLENMRDAVQIGEDSLSIEIKNKLMATPRSIEYFNALYEQNLSEGMLSVIANGLLGPEGAKKFIQQHDTEGILYMDDLAPRLDQGVPSYEDLDLKILELARDQRADDKLEASTVRIISALIDRYPSEDTSQLDPEDHAMVTNFSRYLAKLNSDQYDRAQNHIYRSIPQWQTLLETATKNWKSHLAKSSQLL